MKTGVLRPTTDTARAKLLETITHGCVSVAVIGCSTYLTAIDKLESTAYVGLVGAGIAASGAVSILQGKVTNGSLAEAESLLDQIPGGRRKQDPPAEHPVGNIEPRKVEKNARN